MKKILSLVLILAMVLGVLAGCVNEEPTTTVDPAEGLESAKDYLYAMYKDNNGTAATKGFSLVSVVKIGDVSYPVEWTVDNDEVTLTKDGSYVNVSFNVAPSEKIEFTLTATITGTDGKTATVQISRYVEAVEELVIPEGTIYLYNPNDAYFVTNEVYVYTSTSGSTKNEMVLAKDAASAMKLTVRQNSDGTVTFVTEDNKYLMADGTNVELVDAETENTNFILEAAPGGVYIKCATAEYNGNAQYLEVYSGYLTCYSFNEEKTYLYTFKLIDTNCKHENVEEIAAVAATCTTAGSTAGKKCKDCGVTLEGLETVAALGHTWSEWEVTTEATAEAAGEMKRTCSVCTESETKAYELSATEWVPVNAPEAGKAYKLGMYQANLEANYFITGVKGGYNDLYYATTTAAKEGADVYLEAVEGGYNMYCMVNGEKLYLNMVVSGTYVNGEFEATASTVYTIKDGYLVTKISGVSDTKDGEYAFGTRNDKEYDTIGPVMTSYDGFHCALYIEQEVKNVVIADGDYSIMIDGVYADKVAESSSYGYLYNSNVAVKFTIKNVSDGITIQDDLGRYLTSTSYGTFTVTAEAPADGSHIWTIVKNDDGTYTITNNVTGKIIAHSTTYNSCGVYAADKLTDDHNKNLTIEAWDENAAPVIPTEEGKVTLYFTLKSDSVEIPAWAVPYISGGAWDWADWCAKGSESFKHLEGTDIWYLITDKVTESGEYKIFLNYAIMENHAWQNPSTSTPSEGNNSFTYTAGDKLVDLGEHGFTAELADPATLNFYVVGGFNSWNSTATAMTAVGNGIFESEYLELSEGTEYKITNGNWASGGGIEIADKGGNFKIAATGKYKFRFDANTGVITLVEYKEPVEGSASSVTYDFKDLAVGEKLDDAGLLAVLQAGTTGVLPTEVAQDNVYAGNNSTGGYHQNEAGYLKLGTSKEAGKIVLTYAEGTKVAKVEVYCQVWNSGKTDTVSVNGSEAQQAGATDCECVTFELSEATNVITIETNLRVFIAKIVITFAE